MVKKSTYCPFSADGCVTPTQLCRFWRKRKGCELDALIRDLRSIPNLLKHIGNKLEEGKHLGGRKDG